MDVLKVGGKDLAVAAPDDLAQRVQAATGLSIKEAATILARSDMPSHLAMAIEPLLAEPIGRAELGTLVAETEDRGALRAALAPFYAKVSDAKSE